MLHTKIYGYTLQQIISESETTTIYYAENDLGKKVTIKVLKPEFANNNAVYNRFKQDASILAGLKHAHIQEVYDIIDTETAGCDAILMEYLEGIDLHNYLRQCGKLSVNEGLTYIQQAASALQEAHRKGIIHGDMRPANLILLPNGNIKITHFGSIKTGNQNKTGANFVNDTLNYTAPEQILSPTNINVQSDIYSLGVTLHHLLSGQKPFAENTNFLIEQKIMNDTLPYISGIPDAVITLIQKATRINPNLRFNSVGEIVSTIHHWGNN